MEPGHAVFSRAREAVLPLFKGELRRVAEGLVGGNGDVRSRECCGKAELKSLGKYGEPEGWTMEWRLDVRRLG
jgi:hypothetical protein